MRKEFHLKYINCSLSGVCKTQSVNYFIHNFTVSIFYSGSHNVKCNLCNFRQALCIIMNTKRRIKGLNVIVEKNILANLSVPPQFSADNYTFYNNLTSRDAGMLVLVQTCTLLQGVQEIMVQCLAFSINGINCTIFWDTLYTSLHYFAVFCKLIIWQPHSSSTI